MSETMADTTDETFQTNPLAELNTGFLRDMLVVIDGFDDDPSGQEILTAMRESGYPDCSHGRLYPNIDRLVDNGYVEKGEIDRGRIGTHSRRRQRSVLKNTLSSWV